MGENVLQATGEGTPVVEPTEGLTIRKIGKNTLLITVVDHLDIQKTRTMMSVTEAVIKEHGSVIVFDDWEGVTGYDLRTRIELTEFVFVHRKQLPAVHVLVRSKEVAFGVEVANFVLKYKMKVHATRDTFDSDLARHLAMSMQ